MQTNLHGPPTPLARRPKYGVLPGLALMVLLAGFVSGCTLLRIDVLGGDRDPLQETTIQGPIRNSDGKGNLTPRPDPLPAVVARLNRIAGDQDVKAVVLKINSPGGSVTASEQLYHEIKRFKSRTRMPVVAMLMDVAASGGYYAALPADEILAHPTTLTGSVGVIFLQPKVVGLMDKVGLGMEVTKSGTHKDMGSMFRGTAPEEAHLIRTMVDQLAERFVAAMVQNRPQTAPAQSEIATARIFLGSEALELGLVDGLGYLTDAVARARTLAGLPEDARVVAYQRRSQADPTLYLTPRSYGQGDLFSAAGLWWRPELEGLSTGFHYLWLPEATGLK